MIFLVSTTLVSCLWGIATRFFTILEQTSLPRLNHTRLLASWNFATEFFTSLESETCPQKGSLISINMFQPNDCASNGREPQQGDSEERAGVLSISLDVSIDQVLSMVANTVYADIELATGPDDPYDGDDERARRNGSPAYPS
ncbi:hypothetical protein EDB80DRAFT_737091 [Ilyonectria destructans]|nr:hypothetical protein EDB80DRAFT_737091 [Ilyonectria destructans]